MGRLLLHASATDLLQLLSISAERNSFSCGVCLETVSTDSRRHPIMALCSKYCSVLQVARGPAEGSWTAEQPASAAQSLPSSSADYALASDGSCGSAGGLMAEQIGYRVFLGNANSLESLGLPSIAGYPVVIMFVIGATQWAATAPVGSLLKPAQGLRVWALGFSKSSQDC